MGLLILSKITVQIYKGEILMQKIIKTGLRNEVKGLK